MGRTHTPPQRLPFLLRILPPFLAALMAAVAAIAAPEFLALAIVIFAICVFIFVAFEAQWKYLTSRHDSYDRPRETTPEAQESPEIVEMLNRLDGDDCHCHLRTPKRKPTPPS